MVKWVLEDGLRNARVMDVELQYEVHREAVDFPLLGGTR